MDKQNLYLNIINNIEEGVYIVDRTRTITFWNKAAEEITGYTPEEIVGRHCPETPLDHVDINGYPLCSLNCPLVKTMLDNKACEDLVYVKTKSGDRVPIKAKFIPIEEDGNVVGAIEIFSRNSQRIFDDNIVVSLRDIALHDRLTKLPNRNYLHKVLEHRLTEFKVNDKMFVMLFGDIDNFRYVNNTYGHDAGDIVLQSIANLFLNNSRSDDLICRWGGEEFIGIYPINAINEALNIAEKIRRTVEETPIKVTDKDTINLTISLGATTPNKDDTLKTLIERADLLMYQAKDSGKNKVIYG